MPNAADLSAGLFTLSFPAADFALALFIGALIGIEREKKKTGDQEAAAGLRTFILLAELGATAAWLSLKINQPALFLVTGVLAALAALLGYATAARRNPDAFDLTTQVAVILVYLLGGAVLLGYRQSAVALAIITSALLAYKQPLHDLAGRLDRDDLYAVLKLLIATFVVLPVLPDQTVDPWNALNPYKMWWLVILISGLSFAGYVASRRFGTRRGTALTGVLGGLVSSTVVTLTFARRSREADAGAWADSLAAGLLLAWVVMFLRVLVMVALLAPALLASLAPPLLTMAGIAAGGALLGLHRPAGGAAMPDEVPLRNPFSLTAALHFALFFAAVLVLVQLARQHVSGQGLYVVAGLAGLSDVDAITLSMIDYASPGGAASAMAVNAIIIASVGNTITKCVIALLLGARAFGLRMALATLAILAGGGLVMLLR